MPAGRDVSVSHLIPYRTDFYSHARKGRDKFAEISGNQFRDLYSHTHMGHDQYFLAVQTASVISTHRPTGGVTGHDGNVFTDDGISTHTPARGVTDFHFHVARVLHISTHTPARGVTPIFCILGRSRHHIMQGGLIFLMILNHTSIKNYIFPGEPSGDFGVIEGSLFCEWISI